MKSSRTSIRRSRTSDGPPGAPAAMDRRQAEALLVEKARTDQAFRRALLANPTATIAREFNIDFPTGVTMRVLEETPTELYLVLPLEPTVATLSDRELESVVGGTLDQEGRRNRKEEESASFFSKLR